MAKAAEAFRTISEVADELDLHKHVLRFWEVKFPQIKPMKRGGGRRYYRPADMELLRGIRHLLHAEGYTIKGVQRILRDRGIDVVKRIGVEIIETGTATSVRMLGSKDREAVTDVDGRGSDGASVARGARGERRRGQDRDKASVRATEAARSELQRGITAVIAELEACRALLKGNEAGAAVNASAPQKGKRQVRAAG